MTSMRKIWSPTLRVLPSVLNQDRLLCLELSEKLPDLLPCKCGLSPCPIRPKNPNSRTNTNFFAANRIGTQFVITIGLLNQQSEIRVPLRAQVAELADALG